MRISPTTLELIMTLRDAIQQDGGQASAIAQELSKLPDFEGSKATAGYRITPEGDITDDHWWVIMSDDSILDASDEEPVRCSKKDPRHGRYFPYTGETGIPMEVLQVADHLRAKSRTANNKSFSELMGEASGASAPSGVARQAPEALPDAMTMDGQEGMVVDEFDDETMPEDMQTGDIIEDGSGMMGININDKAAPWTDMILSGDKTIETRNTNSLKPYIGKRVGIVRTGKGPAMLVGYVTIGNPVVYQTAEEFAADYEQHRVPSELTGYEFHGQKFGYPMIDPEPTEPRPLNSRGIVARQVHEGSVMDWDDLIVEDDNDHADALRRTGFWGNAGAGVIFKARDTGRILFAHRSDAVEEPNTWGTWGGAIDDGEQPIQAAMREVQEETGHKPNRNDIVPMYVFSHPSGFKYFNFLVYTDTEFDPRLNWEAQGFEWVEYGDFPEPLHPGAINLLRDPKSSALLAEQPDINEVDHPDYMPDGEGSGTDNYDPTYDERSANSNTGWPSP